MKPTLILFVVSSASIMRLPRDINHPNIRFVGFLNFGATSVTGDWIYRNDHETTAWHHFVASTSKLKEPCRSWNYCVTSFCSLAGDLFEFWRQFCARRLNFPWDDHGTTAWLWPSKYSSFKIVIPRNERKWNRMSSTTAGSLPVHYISRGS